MAEFFDDLETGAHSHAPKDPIWSMDLDDPANEKDILAWLLGELEYLQSKSKDRIDRQRRNLALYKGIQYDTQDTRHDRRDIGASRSNVMKKIVANHLFDLAKNRASRLIKYKPAVAILPTNDEFSDKISAKMTKSLLDHIWYEEHFEDEVSLQCATWAMVMGEVFLFPDWDPQAGDLNPAYKKAKATADQENRKVPLLDENGKQKEDDQGNPIWIDRPIKTGDVKYRIPLPCQVLVERATSWAKANYTIEIETMHVDEARVLYPEAASKIVADEDTQIYDYELMQLRTPRNEVTIYKFMHRRCNFLESGRSIVFTRKEILDNKEFPFTHYDKACVRFTDIDFPGEIHGYSFFEIIKGLTGTYNNLTNMILQNQIMVSRPKWMMPVGAAKLDQLGNDITIVQYKGPTAPQLVQSNPTPAEVFNFRQELKEEFQQIAGISGVSRGEPPPGIKAGVALQFLSEQESERFNELVLKWNTFIKQTAIMTLAVAGDYYDASDERMIRVLGRNNQWMTEFFDVAHLSKDYDVRIQNASALPTSKAARTQTLLDLSERYPNELPGAQVLDLLDLGQSEKFIDIITESIRSAEAENEKLLQIDEAEAAKFEPADYEDHIQHWKIHVRQTQSYSFKNMTPPDKQQNLKDHILITEMMIYNKMQTSPQFAEAVASDPALRLFPVFFVPGNFPPPAAEPPAPEPPMGQPADGPLPVPPGLPVNPALGGEPQELAAPPMPGAEQQLAQEPAIPTAGPTETTGAI
jgi:hypothetical protein